MRPLSGMMMPKRPLVAVLIILLGLTLAPGYAHAVPINGGSGLPSPASTITFDELVISQGTSITNQFASFGVTFSPSLIYSPQGLTNCCDALGDGTNADSGYIGNLNGLPNPFSIKFTGTQTAAAFALSTLSQPSTLFEALLAGNPVPNEFFFRATADEYNQAGQPVGPFFGFSGFAFDEIRVTVGVSTLDDSPGSVRAVIDNIQLSQTPGPDVSPPPVATPEPTTLLLFGTTAGGLGLVRWRRRKHQR